MIIVCFFLYLSNERKWGYMRAVEAKKSLRRDMAHVQWVGIRLLPTVDLEFSLQSYCKEVRLILLQLVNESAGMSVDLATGSTFEMSMLGDDNSQSRDLAHELAAITRNVGRISASMEHDGGALLRLQIRGEEQLFRLHADRPGRLRVILWDWFQDPARPTADGSSLALPCTFGSLSLVG